MTSGHLCHVSAEDIQGLDHKQASDLITLLCRQEYLAASLSDKGVTGGGKHTASDEGIDCLIEQPEVALPEGGYIPRRVSVFQVKAVENLQKNKIDKEIAPNGNLRSFFREKLIPQQGAYIWVSCKDQLDKEKLDQRKTWIWESLKKEGRDKLDEDECSRLTVEYYESEKVAAWVNRHPSLRLWVKDRLNHSTHGWSIPPAFEQNEAFVDDETKRFITPFTEVIDNENKILVTTTATVGVSFLRASLRSGGMHRLIGLSGVGKTGLIKALCDGQVAARAINCNPFKHVSTKPISAGHVYYAADADDGRLQPGAAELARWLREQAESEAVARHGNEPSTARYFLIPDNCSAKTHAQVREALGNCKLVGALTIEHDVREDRPESTTVYRLNPAGKDAIGNYVRSVRSASSSQPIERFADGNFRIAKLLAGSFGGAIAEGITDGELLKRILHLSDKYDDEAASNETIRTARALALAEHFNIDDSDELNVLANVAGLSVQTLKRHIKTLEKRELIQKRDSIHALLPQTLAFRLAADELSEAKESISDCFARAPERLKRAFASRLGYLHLCKDAVAIAQDWLKPGGIAANIPEYIYFLGHASPEAGLLALERLHAAGLPEEIRSDSEFNYVTLLKLTAREGHLFERSVELALRLESFGRDPGRIARLFLMIGCNTNAGTAQKMTMIRSLINSGDPARIDAGLCFLSSRMLPETIVFDRSAAVYGAWPIYGPNEPLYFHSSLDVPNCHEECLTLCEEIALSNDIARIHPHASLRIRYLLAVYLSHYITQCLLISAYYGSVQSPEHPSKLEDLTALSIFATFRRTCKALHQHQSWPEGWIALTIGAKRLGLLDQAECDAWHIIAEEIRPKTLAERAKFYLEDIVLNLYINTNHHNFLILELHARYQEIITSYGQRPKDAIGTPFSIGQELAADPETLKEITPLLCSEARFFKEDFIKTEMIRGIFAEEGNSQQTRENLNQWYHYQTCKPEIKNSAYKFRTDPFFPLACVVD